MKIDGGLTQTGMQWRYCHDVCNVIDQDLLPGLECLDETQQEFGV